MSNNITGTIAKLHSHIDHSGKVEYHLPIGSKLCALNPLVGQNIKLAYTNRIECVHCGTAIKKSYQQGYCFLATRKLAQCDLCILKPELCHHHLGTCREPEWGTQHCIQDHIIYLSYTSGLKVGITRNMPTRWVDQGAVLALPIFKVSSRRISGLLEKALSQHISDKTAWRKMLQLKEVNDCDLINKRDELLAVIKTDITKYQQEFGASAIVRLTEASAYKFIYPVQSTPDKISSFNFDKNPEIEGRLTGIKGQYLIFEHGVINMRKFSGYEITLSSDIELDLRDNSNAQTKPGVCPFSS